MKALSRHTPCGDTIFCDDIRQEITGKVTLVGVYAGSMYLLKPFPAKLGKLALRITYQEHPDESEDPVELHIYLPGNKTGEPHMKTVLDHKFREAGKPLLESTPVFEGDDTEKLLSATFHVEMTDVPLNGAGRIKVRAYRGGDEIRLGSLLVQQLTSPAIAAAAAETGNG